jgi:hypothetical protein
LACKREKDEHRREQNGERPERRMETHSRRPFQGRSQSDPHGRSGIPSKLYGASLVPEDSDRVR